VGQISKALYLKKALKKQITGLMILTFEIKVTFKRKLIALN
jgi:hypothetical protein